MQTQKITPKIARDILAKNDNNRPLSPMVVSKYAAIMEAGKWKFNGDTISIDTNGNLINGQHRLSAIIKADKSIDGIIVTGLDPSVFTTIDVGKKRTPGDALAVAFGIPSANDCAAVCAFLYHYKNSIKTNKLYERNKKIYLDHADIISTFKDNSVKIPQFINQYNRLHTINKFISRSQYAALKLLMHKVDPKDAKEFWSKMDNGANLGAQNPINVLRNQFIEGLRINQGKKMDRDVTFNLIAKTWNLWRTDQKVTSINLKPEDSCELK